MTGNLFLAVPVGRSRVCFNTHRVHSSFTTGNSKNVYRSRIMELSGVHDDGRIVVQVGWDKF